TTASTFFAGFLPIVPHNHRTTERTPESDSSSSQGATEHRLPGSASSGPGLGTFLRNLVKQRPYSPSGQ
ncbi:MAG: hypothetical protein K2X39_08400, partial [Silvanigrellaceae bacterium]|nr:hypothetical protein [Silvanigrellaceae bacterium]